MIAAYRKMKQRKKEWIAEQQRDFQRIHDSINAEAMAYGNVYLYAYLKKEQNPF